MPPNAIMFIRSVTNPSNGARICRLSMLRRATSTATCAFVRFSRRTAARCDRRLALALDVHFELRQALARFVEAAAGAARPERADQFVGAGVELGAPTLEPGLQQRDFVVGRLRRGFGLRLGDFLLRELQVELGLLERELLLGRIELDDDVAGLDAPYPTATS